MDEIEAAASILYSMKFGNHPVMTRRTQSLLEDGTRNTASTSRHQSSSSSSNQTTNPTFQKVKKDEEKSDPTSDQRYHNTPPTRPNLPIPQAPSPFVEAMHPHRRIVTRQLSRSRSATAMEASPSSIPVKNALTTGSSPLPEVQAEIAAKLMKARRKEDDQGVRKAKEVKKEDENHTFASNYRHAQQGEYHPTITPVSPISVLIDGSINVAKDSLSHTAPRQIRQAVVDPTLEEKPGRKGPRLFLPRSASSELGLPIAPASPVSTQTREEPASSVYTRSPGVRDSRVLSASPELPASPVFTQPESRVLPVNLSMQMETANQIERHTSPVQDAAMMQQHSKSVPYPHQMAPPALSHVVNVENPFPALDNGDGDNPGDIATEGVNIHSEEPREEEQRQVSTSPSYVADEDYWSVTSSERDVDYQRQQQKARIALLKASTDSLQDRTNQPSTPTANPSFAAEREVSVDADRQPSGPAQDCLSVPTIASSMQSSARPLAELTQSTPRQLGHLDHEGEMSVEPLSASQVLARKQETDPAFKSSSSASGSHECDLPNDDWSTQPESHSVHEGAANKMPPPTHPRSRADVPWWIRKVIEEQERSHGNSGEESAAHAGALGAARPERMYAPCAGPSLPHQQLHQPQGEQVYEMTCPQCQDCGSKAIEFIRYYGTCDIMDPSRVSPAQPNGHHQPQSILKPVQHQIGPQQATRSVSQSSSDAADDHQRMRSAPPMTAAQKKVRIISPERHARASVEKKTVSNDHASDRIVREKQARQGRTTLRQAVENAMKASDRARQRAASAALEKPLAPSTYSHQAQRSFDLPGVRPFTSVMTPATTGQKAVGTAQRLALGTQSASANIPKRGYMNEVEDNQRRERDNSGSLHARVSRISDAEKQPTSAQLVKRSTTLAVRRMPARQPTPNREVIDPREHWNSKINPVILPQVERREETSAPVARGKFDEFRSQKASAVTTRKSMKRPSPSPQEPERAGIEGSFEEEEPSKAKRRKPNASKKQKVTPSPPTSVRSNRQAGSRPPVSRKKSLPAKLKQSGKASSAQNFGRRASDASTDYYKDSDEAVESDLDEGVRPNAAPSRVAAMPLPRPKAKANPRQQLLAAEEHRDVDKGSLPSNTSNFPNNRIHTRNSDIDRAAGRELGNSGKRQHSAGKQGTSTGSSYSNAPKLRQNAVPRPSMGDGQLKTAAAVKMMSVQEQQARRPCQPDYEDAGMNDEVDEDEDPDQYAESDRQDEKQEEHSMEARPAAARKAGGRRPKSEKKAKAPQTRVTKKQSNQKRKSRAAGFAVQGEIFEAKEADNENEGEESKPLKTLARKRKATASKAKGATRGKPRAKK